MGVLLDQDSREVVSEVWDVVAGEGPIPAVGMIIGEAPGAAEEREGRPFVGPSGRRLEEALEAAGGTRSMYYITNVYKNRPPNNRDPNQEELWDHAELLDEEIVEANPPYILVLGRVAQKWMNRLGYRYEFYAMHPAATLYDPRNKDKFFEQVGEFVTATLRSEDERV